MATYKAIIFDEKNHIKKDGTVNIKIRITHNRKLSYNPTDLFILPNQFNRKTGWTKSGRNKSYINLQLQELWDKYFVYSAVKNVYVIRYRPGNFFPSNFRLKS